ncbi:MAG: glutaminase, partial [Microbacterium sp.]|nr:glutaminase [Microbacterium sp.]
MFESDATDIPQLSSTGVLPEDEEIAELVRRAHERYSGDDEGVVADYIPILAQADPSWFGLTVVGVDGKAASAG